MILELYKILIVEDDKLLNEGLTFALRKYGFDTVSAFSSEDAEKYNFMDIDFHNYWRTIFSVYNPW